MVMGSTSLVVSVTAVGDVVGPGDTVILALLITKLNSSVGC